MLYSLFFYTALSAFSAYGIIILAVPIMEKGKLDFTESVSYYCNILFTLPHFPSAPLNWMKGAKLADFINNWEKFQNLFEQVTGKSLRLRLRRRAWVAAIFIPLSGMVIMFTVLVLKSGLELTWMTLAMEVQGSYALSLVMVHGVMWILLCLALQSSGVQLRSIFKQVSSTGRHAKLSAWSIPFLNIDCLNCFRPTLDIERELGDIYCYSLGLICLIWFAIFLCSIYVILITSIKMSLSDLEVDFIFSAIVCFSFLVFICNYAYNHTIQLGSGFQELVVSSMSSSNPRVKKEYLSTTVTYLVVLLQFGIQD
ncbi:unnamed protein product [Timema podura]|uniref:Gustatory receptor n=1 Tax=Timema podura TaxID=61482 RepID=A0ABN7P2X5_TIMPD|nr:unnamed protein product [Timema podura]